MTNFQQRVELQRRIWQIANDDRGAVNDQTLNSTYWAPCFIGLSAKSLRLTLKAVTRASTTLAL